MSKYGTRKPQNAGQKLTEKSRIYILSNNINNA